MEVAVAQYHCPVSISPVFLAHNEILVKAKPDFLVEDGGRGGMRGRRDWRGGRGRRVGGVEGWEGLEG